MEKAAIFHIGDSEYCYLSDEGKVILTLKAKKGDMQKVVMVYDDRYVRNPKAMLISKEAYLAGSDEVSDYFRVSFECRYTRLAYYFILTDKEGNTEYYGMNGVQDMNCYDNRMRFQLPYLHRTDSPNIPLWYKNSVMYQVFPDSFAQSRNKVEEVPSEKSTNGITVKSKIGGTINGIRENIPYFKELGVDLLYINPIFTAVSYHKYDTIDYCKIDPGMGTNDDFARLVGECHQNGIRIMLDLVFSSCSMEHPAFLDVREKGEDSEYADWYIVHKYPVVCKENPDYECFAFFGEVPKYNIANQKVIEYLIEAGRYWLTEYHIDGYRLDVANELSHEFWRKFRMEMQRIKPDIVLIGEAWHHANSFVGNGQFHGVMNFPLLFSVWEFFGYDMTNVQQFAESLTRLTMLYKWDNTCAMMNFLDNHDTMRFINVAQFDRCRQKLAFAFLISFVGVPLVYYGDEKSLEGSSTEDSRRKMIWQDEPTNEDMFKYYKKLIAIRKQYPVLIEGGFQIFAQDVLQNVLGFTRENETDTLYCLFNRSPYRSEITLPKEGTMQELITGQTLTSTVHLEPYQAMICRAL